MTKNTPHTKKRERTSAPAATDETLNVATSYRPEIEARRGEYKRLAEVLLTMIDLETEHLPSLLDADLSGGSIHTEEGDEHLLMHALERHLFLAFESVDWYAPEAMRLYVELRLLADEQSAQRQKAAEVGPEPPDQTTPEWRDWKVRQIEQALRNG